MTKEFDPTIEAALIQAAATLTTEYLRQNEANERARAAKADGCDPAKVERFMSGGTCIAVGDIGQEFSLILKQLRSSYRG